MSLTAEPVAFPYGTELIRATKPFAVENRGRTWWLFVQVAVGLVGAMALAAAPVLLPVRLAASALIALLLLRVFMFFHDFEHKAIWRRSRAAGALMAAVGWLILAPIPIWKETHDYHHRNNAKLLGSAIGSFPVVTTGMWRGMDSRQRLGYRLARHPLTIASGYLTIFVVGMCLRPFVRSRRHWQGPAALAVHVAGVTALVLTLGWTSAVLAVLAPWSVAMALGAYLFYVQHNFPGIELRGRRDWDYVHAALRASSMFEMSPVMHWFTGNIGYHHVHHLNSHIPFYRLPEVVEAFPEQLTHPHPTSWRLRDVRACLRLGLWDPELQTMVPLPRGSGQ